MNYVEPDPPLFAMAANDLHWQGNVGAACVAEYASRSNSISAQTNGLLIDQLMRLKEENYRQSNRIAFLEAALETAQAQLEQALALGKTPADDDFKIVPSDSPYYVRAVAPQMRKIEGDAAAKVFQDYQAQQIPGHEDRIPTPEHTFGLPSPSEALSRALRLPNTPDPYGR